MRAMQAWFGQTTVVCGDRLSLCSCFQKYIYIYIYIYTTVASCKEHREVVLSWRFWQSSVAPFPTREQLWKTALGFQNLCNPRTAHVLCGKCVPKDSDVCLVAGARRSAIAARNPEP